MRTKVIQFAAIRRLTMASTPVPNPANEVQISPPQIVPTPQANVTHTAYAQMTQVASYVPPNVWTTEALLDLHAKQREIAMRNVDSLDDQRRRENLLAWGGVVMFAGIVGFGCYLVTQGNSLGKDLIGSTVL